MSQSGGSCARNGPKASPIRSVFPPVDRADGREFDLVDRGQGFRLELHSLLPLTSYWFVVRPANAVVLDRLALMQDHREDQDGREADKER